MCMIRVYMIQHILTHMDIVQNTKHKGSKWHEKEARTQTNPMGFYRKLRVSMISRFRAISNYQSLVFHALPSWCPHLFPDP